MRPTVGSAAYALTLCAGLVAGDSYANNQNVVVVDSPQVTANFPDVGGVQLLSPAFINNGTVPETWSIGTSGPTPQSTLGTFIDRDRSK
jgi:hypothetical protein